jgi:hypothetical protein
VVVIWELKTLCVEVAMLSAAAARAVSAVSVTISTTTTKTISSSNPHIEEGAVGYWKTSTLKVRQCLCVAATAEDTRQLSSKRTLVSVRQAT